MFDARTSEVLLHVLDRVIEQTRQAGISREDWSELGRALAVLTEAQTRSEERLSRVEGAVERLTEAQTRSEERLSRVEGAIERLTEAQARTDEQVRKLVEAQAHTEERVGRLEAAIERLTEAQTRTERAIEKLSQQVGGLSDTVGGDIEDIAYIVLYDVLKREFGWQVGVLRRSWQMWGKELEEIDVFGQASDPKQPGKAIWIVGEAKHNLTIADVKRFVRRVERARQHLTGEVFPVCFCYRARPEVQQMVKEAGIHLVFSYGRFG